MSGHAKVVDLEPTGYFMYRQFNNKNFTFCPQSAFVLHASKKNNDYFPTRR